MIFYRPRYTSLATTSLLVVLAMSLSACGHVPKENFYTLDVPAFRATDARPTTIRHRISLDKVSVPDMVDRLQWVVHTSDYQVEIKEFELWAEPLRTTLPRVIAQTLRQNLDASTQLMTYPSELGEVDYRINIDILRFESRLNQYARIDAIWQLRDRTGKVVNTAPLTYRQITHSAGFTGLVEAHQLILRAMSQDIAQILQSLP